MPDWSYLTVFAPALRWLPPRRARDLTLGAFGSLGGLRCGPQLISAFGHMQPPAAAGLEVLGLRLISRVGIGGEVDPRLLATSSLGLLGVGFVEVGPVSLEPHAERDGPCISADGAAMQLQADPVSLGLEETRRRLKQRASSVPLLVRIAPTLERSTSETVQLTNGLDEFAAAFVLDTRRLPANISELMRCARATTPRPILLGIPPAIPPDVLARLVCASPDGYVVSGGIERRSRRDVGRAAAAPASMTVRALRELAAPEAVVIADTGIYQPAEAIEALAGGADLMLLHAGLVASGPGLPKRINEAIVAAGTTQAEAPARPLAWVPLLLLGIGLVVGGLLAWLIAATRVVLPYDEAFLGLDRDALPSINARLLAFMAHDRVTLAGTMLSIGVLYSQLAFWGVRAGAHWAWQVILWSSGLGFASFFLFLGFGYFDPLHATVSVVLFAFFLLGTRGAPRVGDTGHSRPGLTNSPAWRSGLWGQLCFVALGVGLILAGLTIAYVGIAGVLVPEDVRFLETPAALLRAANPRLLPLVAHDRAGFGGALVSDGLAVLLTSLWGFREGARRVWWTLLGAGVAGFGGALGVHFAVGYLDAVHLAPALIGSALLALALALSYQYLCASLRSSR